MKTWIPISMMFVVLGAQAFGQALPTATEVVTPSPSGVVPRVSWVDGTVHYAPKCIPSHSIWILWLRGYQAPQRYQETLDGFQ